MIGEVTEHDLTVMEARLNAASPAPWYAWSMLATGSNGWADRACVANLPLVSVGVGRGVGFLPADARFIAEARTTEMAALIREVRRLKREIDGWLENTEHHMKRCLTTEECRALYDLLEQLSGHSPENVFALDGTDSMEDITTRACVKLFCAAGRTEMVPTALVIKEHP
jgi:hypothetical protein